MSGLIFGGVVDDQENETEELVRLDLSVASMPLVLDSVLIHLSTIRRGKIVFCSGSSLL